MGRTCSDGEGCNLDCSNTNCKASCSDPGARCLSECSYDCECLDGAECMFKCQSGQCNLDCDGEKTICNTPCHGGQQCNCTGGAICEMPCSADNCNMTCGNGSVCDFDCNNDNGDMICQKGSLCEMECAAGAQNCRASCAPGADCILVIPEVTTGLNIDRSGMVGCDNPTVCSNRVWICGDYFSCPQRSAPALLQEINNGLSLAHRHPPAMHRTSP